MTHADASESLLAVARALGELKHLPGVSQVIADAVPTIGGSDRGAVILWDERDQTYVVSAIACWTGDVERRLALWTGTPFTAPQFAELMEGGAPVLLDGSGQRWASEVVKGFDIRALAMVPIRAGGRPMGFIAAHWAETDPPAELDERARDRLMGLASLAGIAIDNTRLASEIEWNVHHDHITRLPNRISLEHSLTRMIELADASANGVVVVVCDIDRFKRLNDRAGMEQGDKVLRETGERLRSAVRPADIVARYGSDEFAIAFARASSYDAVAPAIARIQRAFTTPFKVGEQQVVISLSMGAATLEEHRDGGTAVERAQRLAASAESELMRKQAARRSMRSELVVEDELLLDTDLHGAVARGEITAVYQPQVDVETGRIVAVEALARWEHPTRGLIRPDQFIALAEENGTITEIGQAVLLSACRDALTWDKAGHRVEVSVNASVLQLERPGFAASVVAATAGLGFPPGRLTIEVTESKVVTDVSTAQAELRALGAQGVGVSIDDFGTGFSSLTQISNLPVSELKIDRSFVERLSSDDEKLVAAVIGLSRGLGLRVVAEGVETQEQHDALARLGCDRAQGYLYSRPIPADALLRLLQVR